MEETAKLGRTVVGPYALRRPLGEGGMGTVFRARRAGATTDVALKVLTAAARDDADYAERFRREIALHRSIDHPAIVRVLDSGVDDGLAFLVMELIEGRSLASRLASDPRVPATDVISVGVQLASGLVYLHARGVLHRDLKPSNILLDQQGRARLADLGLARVDDQTPLTRTGAVMGTVAYLAPEQARAENPTAACDVYALGLVLYEALCGQLPYRAGSMLEWIRTIIDTPAPPPSQHVAGLPAALDRLLLAMLEKTPEARPDAAEVLARFEELAAALAPKAPRATAPPVAQADPVPSLATPRPSVSRPAPTRSGPGRPGWQVGAGTALSLALLAMVWSARPSRPVPPVITPERSQSASAPELAASSPPRDASAPGDRVAGATPAEREVPVATPAPAAPRSTRARAAAIGGAWGSSAPGTDGAPASSLQADELAALRRRAGAGEAQALFELAERHETGRGVTADKGEARRLYTLSLEAGNELARARLERLGAR